MNLLGFLDLRWDFFWVFKTKWFYFRVISFNAFWKIVMVRKFGMGFLGG